jgi:hypothetical protein
MLPAGSIYCTPKPFENKNNLPLILRHIICLKPPVVAFGATLFAIQCKNLFVFSLMPNTNLLINQYA